VTVAELEAHVVAVLADIAPEADLAVVDRDAPLREALDLDSMDFLRLLQGLHARTGVDVPEAEYGRVRTLAGLLAWLEARAR
jgi:acyl carrier protein